MRDLMKMKLLWAGWQCRLAWNLGVGLASLTAGTSVSSPLEGWFVANSPSGGCRLIERLATTNSWPTSWMDGEACRRRLIPVEAFLLHVGPKASRES